MTLGRISLAIFYFSLTACVSVQSVSMADLLSNPQSFDGKRIRVEAHIAYGFENCIIDGKIWYWPQNQSCYGIGSYYDAWEGQGAVIGTVSLANHGHLDSFPFALINARVIRR